MNAVPSRNARAAAPGLAAIRTRLAHTPHQLGLECLGHLAALLDFAAQGRLELSECLLRGCTVTLPYGRPERGQVRSELRDLGCIAFQSLLSLRDLGAVGSALHHVPTHLSVRGPSEHRDQKP